MPSPNARRLKMFHGLMMNPLEWIMRGRFAAAARAGAGFVTVSIVGAMALIVLAIVLWAASLTPFGLWAGVPVIAAGGIVALALWRQGQPGPASSRRSTAPLDFAPSSRWSPGAGRAGGPGRVEAEPARLQRVKLIPMPSVPRLLRPTAKAPKARDADDLKRTFDQALAAAEFDEAERILSEVAAMPGQGDWARRKQLLVRQQRARS